MQVLKFGGTSVGDASAAKRVGNIVLDAVEQDSTIVVASAIKKATDQLREIGHWAEKGDESYKEKLAQLKQRHFEMIDELLQAEFRKELSAEIEALFCELSGICSGVALIRELSFHTLDLIMSFGELCSTKILATKFTSIGVS